MAATNDPPAPGPREDAAPTEPGAGGGRRERDEPLASIVHDLRSPLNAILGWAHVLLGTASLEAGVREGLEAIARNARAQASVIDELAAEVARRAGGRDGDR